MEIDGRMRAGPRATGANRMNARDFVSGRSNAKYLGQMQKIWIVRCPCFVTFATACLSRFLAQQPPVSDRTSSQVAAVHQPRLQSADVPEGRELTAPKTKDSVLDVSNAKPLHFDVVDLNFLHSMILDLKSPADKWWGWGCPVHLPRLCDRRM